MTVDDCGTSVPDVSDVLDVVPEAALVDVVDRAVVVEVVADELEVGLFEQAAKAKAQTGRIKRLIDRLRGAVGMAQCTAAADPHGGCARSVVPPECPLLRFQARPGAVPITEARSIERRWGQ